MTTSLLPVIDLGRMDYAAALDEQQIHHAEVLIERALGSPRLGRLLLVEHDPVITVTRRPGAVDHIIATRERLDQLGVQVTMTDRGGDVTYHGPGQLVVYPIIDLKRIRIRLVDYMRLLESAVIDALSSLGVESARDEGATGVWVPGVGPGGADAKICAMGVRVRRWVTLHGLALNIDPELAMFELIVPCGLHGRPVTSLRALLGDRCPSMSDVAETIAQHLRTRILYTAQCAGADLGGAISNPDDEAFRDDLPRTAGQS